MSKSITICAGAIVLLLAAPVYAQKAGTDSSASSKSHKALKVQSAAEGKTVKGHLERQHSASANERSIGTPEHPHLTDAKAAPPSHPYFDPAESKSPEQPYLNKVESQNMEQPYLNKAEKRELTRNEHHQRLDNSDDSGGTKLDDIDGSEVHPIDQDRQIRN